MDTAQWPQEIVVKPIEEIVTNNTCPKPASASSVLERKVRPQKEQALNCPRCNSTNTKFCYYNNYSLTQPRYFCKTCRRYWTEGGSLRNIPVGGGSRKNKRSTSSSHNSNPPPLHSKKLPDLVHPQNNPKIIPTTQSQDLNLSFQSTHQDFNTNLSELVNNPSIAAAASSTTSASQQLSALELLTGMTNSRGLNSFIPMPVPSDPTSVYSAGFHLHDQFKPSLNFSLDGALGNGYGNLQGVPASETNSANGRLLLPFEDLKQVSASTTNGVEQSKKQGDSTGFWTGMLGGGSWILSELPKGDHGLSSTAEA